MSTILSLAFVWRLVGPQNCYGNHALSNTLSSVWAIHFIPVKYPKALFHSSVNCSLLTLVTTSILPPGKHNNLVYLATVHAITNNQQFGDLLMSPYLFIASIAFGLVHLPK